MDHKSGEMDYWRNYFRGAESDIFEVIDKAILVAASDCPKEFRIRRSQIAEHLFSCRLTRCVGCDSVQLMVPKEEEEEEDDDGELKGRFGEIGSGKESKVNSGMDDHGELNKVSNYSYDDAEALTEEIEEESQIIGEVLRIKEVLRNYREESEGVLFESLRKLQLMGLTVEMLKETEIGKAVNGLRRHGSKRICNLSRTLIDEWKYMVDEWVNAASAIQGGTPDSLNPSVVDEEEGLPSPPLDEGIFFATQTTSLELSQFFDGMDDDGNPRCNGEFNKNHESGRKPGLGNCNPKKEQPPNEANVPKNDKCQVQKQQAVTKQTNSSNNFGPGRPPMLRSDTKLPLRPELHGIQKKPSALQDKSKQSDDASVRAKLEATKRKLQEGYQQAENAKKQRTIRVMELHDLPKQGQGLRHKVSHLKPGTHNRHWANGRR